MGIWGGKKADPVTQPVTQPVTTPPPVIPETSEAKAVKPAVVDQPSPSKEATMAITKREDEVMLRGGGEVNAVLGKGTEFEGKLSFEGEVRIAGKFTGEIFSKDRLQIDDSAKVSAEISAGAVVVFGEVIGNIKAAQLIELKSTARVKGNIEAPSLVIEKGVIFEGSCKMENLGKGATITPLKQADEKK